MFVLSCVHLFIRLLVYSFIHSINQSCVQGLEVKREYLDLQKGYRRDASAKALLLRFNHIFGVNFAKVCEREGEKVCVCV